MYNLLISLGAGLAAFGLGALFGRWYYGFAPAMLVAPTVYFFLARRTGQQVEAIMKRAVSKLQTGKMDAAKAIMEEARPLGKWQLLVEAQIDGQLGALEYMQRRPKAARPLLEKAWKRNWQAQAMLAILDSKEGKVESGINRLDKAKLLARKEVLFWAIQAWLHIKAKDTDEAMRRLNDGIEAAENPAALKQLHGAIQNGRMKRFDWGKTFGQGWYQFFPEQYPAARNQPVPGGFRGGRGYPQQGKSKSKRRPR